MPVRRRRPRRRPRPRPFPWLPLLAVCIALVLLWRGIAAVQRQIAGYFPSVPAKRHVVMRKPTPLPQVPVRTRSAATEQPRLGAQLGSLGAVHPPVVAIIIDDCGNNLVKDEQFLGLPAPLTFAILPLTAHGREIAYEAASIGKPIMLHLPMQPESSEHNPGPGAITTGMSDAQIAAQVEQDLSSLPPVPGANNHMGSKGTADPRVMRAVLAVLKQRRLFFIDSETTNESIGAQLARTMGLQTAARDVFLDDEVSEPAIEAQMRDAAKIARQRGQAIAIGHPFPETALALAKMIPKMQSEGVEFVAAETLVK